MDIIENITIEINFSRLVLALGSGERIPQIREKAYWAKETMEQIAQPKIIVGIFAIKSRGIDFVTVSSENGSTSTVLEVGQKGVDLLADACCTQISFVTLGDKLHALGNNLKKQGRLLKQYVLDIAAVMALYHVGQIVNQTAEQTAVQNGWGVGRRISPGDLHGWPLAGQCVLEELLPVKDIGIEIKPTGLLMPLKSASGLVGMGPSYTSNRVGTVCRWCQNRKTCPIKLSERNQEFDMES